MSKQITAMLNLGRAMFSSASSGSQYRDMPGDNQNTWTVKTSSIRYLARVHGVAALAPVDHYLTGGGFAAKSLRDDLLAASWNTHQAMTKSCPRYQTTNGPLRGAHSLFGIERVANLSLSFIRPI